MSGQPDPMQVMLNGEDLGSRRLAPRDLERRGCCFATRSDTETIVHGYKGMG